MSLVAKRSSRVDVAWRQKQRSMDGSKARSCGHLARSPSDDRRIFEPFTQTLPGFVARSNTIPGLERQNTT